MAVRNDESTLPADPADLPLGRRVSPRGTMIGRFVVLDERGQGGQGQVFAAYDPELDRKIALKLLRPDGTTGRSREAASARLVREAQTMAKVSHPNVVAVFDVGTLDDELFLAMELIDGPDLAVWLRAEPRPWRDVLDLFVMAGRGLAAAHAAGLVHRDFKPSNVILSGETAKVTDFGLAKPAGSDDSGSAVPTVSESPSPPRSSDLTAPGAVVGTPRYMAPEQREGRADARADQFSFCVALDESLRDAVGAPPRAIRKVLARGLRPDPAERFPSMDALLDALGRASRRRVWIALAAAAGAGAVALGALAIASPEESPCAGGRARLDGIWDATVRARVEAAFAEAAPRGAAVFAIAGDALDDYGDRWVAAHRETCEATRVRREQTPELMDLRMACLDARRAELGALAGQLAAADAGSLSTMAQAVHKLRPLAGCADPPNLMAPTRPPDDAAAVEAAAVRTLLGSARALGHVGKYGDAVPVAQQAVERARAMAWRPLIAEALLDAGMLTAQAGKPGDAEPLLLEAVWMAEASRHDRAAAEAWTTLVFAIVQQGERYERAPAWSARADAAIERIEGDRDLRGRLENHLGAVAYMEGRYPEAKAHWERALAEATALHPEDHPDVARASNNLGIVSDDLGEGEAAERYYRRAIEIWTASLGADHPLVASASSNLGSLLRGRGQVEDAVALYRRAIEIYEASLGAEHPSIADTLVNLGNALLPLGRHDEAFGHYRRALAIREKAFGPDSAKVAGVLSSLGTAYREKGDTGQALVELERALAIQVAAIGADHPTTAITRVALGETHLTRGDPAAARPHFEHGLRVFEAAHGREHVMTAYALSGLGRALLLLGDARAARPLLEDAVAAREAAGEAQPLAESRFALARLLHAAGEREQAWKLVELARPQLEKGHIDPDLDLAAWIAKHPR